MVEKAAYAFGEDLGNAKFNFPENPPKIEIQVAAGRFALASTGAETSGQVDDLDSQSNSLSSSKALQYAESPCPSIVNAVQSDHYFQQSSDDELGTSTFTPLQKCTVVIRQLAYGGATNQYDEYLRIAESTSLECLSKSCRVIVQLFSAEYLRRLMSADCQRLFALHEYGSGDARKPRLHHWAWKDCPVAWQGAYIRGDQGEPTIFLEAVASQDMWI
ncbi:uncharacterized protein LOC131009739 [Salvia miltiorrhiza]|uniref:uncharacterized protein LOC131009739 n=1 Tax=Salvia miltiorrhiza TaxID=226208 RepID=UPI0025AC4ADD|nr:uncharacterized protein LOC131009739 [Salvia miltiorrhiza]